MHDTILQEEANRRWGHTPEYKESVEKVQKMTKSEMDQVKKEGGALLKRAATLVDKDVESAEVQDFIKEHYKHLSHFYTPNPEIYKGLAEMYIADPRFKSHFEKYHPKLPQFMHRAMLVFVGSL